jgi:hypothetical protein
MQSNEVESRYKSARLLLEAIQKEYEYDINKLSDLYSRTGIIIAVLTVYLGYVLSNSDYFTFFRTSLVQKIGCTENIILNCLYFCSIVFVFVSGYYFLKVLITASYIRLDPSKGFNQTIADQPEEENAFYLMQRYTEIVLNNKPTVDKKTRYYKLGIIFLEISIVFSFFYAIYIKFIGL